MELKLSCGAEVYTVGKIRNRHGVIQISWSSAEGYTSNELILQKNLLPLSKFFKKLHEETRPKKK